MTIRLATSADASIIRDIAERTFRETYAALNPPELMEQYVAEAFTVEQVLAEIGAEGETFFLAEVDGVVCGYAKLRSGQAPAGVAGGAPVELERIYVDTAFHGRGIGRALLDRCTTEAARQGHDDMWLGVWGQNERAVAFYRKAGFRVVGTKVFVFSGDPQEDLVMARAIAT